MPQITSIDDYLARHNRWSDSLTTLRRILRSTDLEETIKWGMPTYTLNGKNVLILAAFKNHAALWFVNGASLKDPAGKLVNAQEGKTKSQRQWRFGQGEDIDETLVRRYVIDAIAIQRAASSSL